MVAVVMLLTILGNCCWKLCELIPGSSLIRRGLETYCLAVVQLTMLRQVKKLQSHRSALPTCKDSLYSPVVWKGELLLCWFPMWACVGLPAELAHGVTSDKARFGAGCIDTSCTSGHYGLLLVEIFCNKHSCCKHE